MKTKQASPAINLKAAKPFLKWVGGKGGLLAQYQSLFPLAYKKYYEPFVGGGAVFFSLQPKQAHINDANHTLIHAYINIRDSLDDVITELATLETRYRSLRDEDARKEFYYETRAKFNELSDDDFDKTPLLIFLNKTCFNGLYRENSKGGFNVPFGKYANPTICDENNLRQVAAVLKNAEVTSESFEEAVKDASKGDFIYFDPPYHPLNPTSSFTSYHENDFTAADQEKLRDVFKDLSTRGCLVMLSNSDTPLIRELYKEYKIHTVYAGRAINSVAAKRGKITEVVVTNY